MVAYSFKARFADAIRAGYKTQTIRAGRARHARPGEMLQLFTGMRTAHCKKICEDVRCTDVRPIGIRFSAAGETEGITVGGDAVRDLDAFAIQDGFADLYEMSDFWLDAHKKTLGWGTPILWTGVVIEWAAPHATPLGLLP